MIIRIWYTIIFYILIKFTGLESKPLKHPIIEHSNTIHYGSQGDYKTLHSERKSSSLFTPPSFPVIIKTNNAEGRANDEMALIETTEINNSTKIQTSENTPTSTSNSNLNNFNNNNNLLTTLLAPLFQKFHFSPQTFLQDRLNSLKQVLTNFGLLLPTDQTAKQFTNLNKLLNFVGLDDSGFYTDRLEPGGLLDGNGWFSNKGGLLGGPGAIISTGPLLTDYPIPYRKK